MLLQWRHNERGGVWNDRRLDCLPNRLFGRWPKKTSKLCVDGLCEGNPPVTGASNAENVSIWWRHYAVAFAAGSPCVAMTSTAMMLAKKRCKDTYSNE